MKVKIKTFWPGIVMLILATIAFFIPGPELPKQEWMIDISIDKLVHVGLFAVLVVLWCLPAMVRIQRADRQRSILLWITLGFLLYGILIEFIQGNFIEGRTFGVDDMIADALGCLIGFLVVKYQAKSTDKI